jgi:hypothetical protein
MLVSLILLQNIYFTIKTEILKSDFGTQMDSDEGGAVGYERSLSDREGEQVSDFLRKVLPELEQVLEANTTSTAFDG